MSKFTVTVLMEMKNFDHEQEAKEAAETILSTGLAVYEQNYGKIMQKEVLINKFEISLTVPPIKLINEQDAAKLISRFIPRIEDRQNGIFANRGPSSGTFYIIEAVLINVLKEMHADQYFQFFQRNGTNKVLIQDILGNVVHDFVEVPDKIMDLAKFFMTLSEHYKKHEVELKQFDNVEISQVVNNESFDSTTREIANTVIETKQIFESSIGNKMDRLRKKLNQKFAPIALVEEEEDEDDV